MPGSRSWDDERDELMAECFGRKMSCAATAVALNKRFGSSYSRNAVIGRALRKGIATAGISNLSHRPARDPAAWRSSGVTKRTYQRRKAKERAMQAKPQSQQFICEPMTGLRVADVVPLNIAIYDLTDETCRWPFGDDPPFVYCGCPTFDGSPYCEPHAALSIGAGTIGERLAARLPRAA